MAEEQHEERTIVEEIELTGEQIWDEIKRLLHEGNARRVRIKRGDEIILNLPLTVVAVSTILAPALTGLTLLGALASDYSVVVERVEPPPKKQVKVEVEAEDEA